ncbi:MAG: lmo0937 family membrane protein [Methylobacter sp.]
MVSSYTLCGFVHLLLVLAIIMIVISVIQGRPPL